ncbi:hypothetical protein Patl1_33374 [Pistacia atlantica]|uniref:Uncharacterized protein n=1 Tax=Pistacia atlantica TaxID=434234 RepID=A0ACC0ZW33_9ROSI|nr:hypothetical protein Patl1_33374 [Pistacia atlantica]
MSVKKTLSLKSKSKKEEAGKKDYGNSSKRRRFDSCFSFREISIEPEGSSLKDVDSNELKSKIVRWAKAVVAYARQVSGKFGSTRGSDKSGGENSPRT